MTIVKISLIAIVLMGMSWLLFAQGGARTQTWVSSQTGLMVVPNSPAAVPNIGGVVVELDSGWLSNTTGSTVTVTFTDGTTSCNGAACQPFAAVTLQPNAAYPIDFRGLIVTGGLFWQAGTANAVQGWIKGRK